MQLSPWQRLRTRAFLFAIGLKRRMTLGARVVAIDGDRVLLVRQAYMPGWQFPGGGVEPGETSEISAARELLEETGYRATAPMQLFGLYHNVNVMTNRDHVVLYLCREFEKLHAFAPNVEIAEAGWFAVDALPPDMSAGTQRRIDEIFGAAPVSATW